MNKRYIATLAGAALLILVIGLLIQPSDAVQVPVPEAEGAQLQQMSQERALRVEASYLADRVASVSSQVVYLAEQQAPGVRWDSTGLVIATLPETPIMRALAERATQVAQPVGPPESARWVLAVARQADGSTTSAVGLSGGTAATQCNDQGFSEMVLDFALQPALAGAGLFDLNGRRLGMIVHCDGRLAALPNRELERAWNEAESTTGRLERQFGLVVTQLTNEQRTYFGASSGLLIVQVNDGSIADNLGLRPGDILRALDGRDLSAPKDLAPLFSAPADSTHTFTLLRGGRELLVRLTPATANPPNSLNEVQLRDSAGVVAISNVKPGSPLYEAGLRPGDRVLQVANASRPGLSAVRRALQHADSVPVFIVIQRGSLRRGLLVSR